MPYVINENRAGGQPFSATSTTAKHALRERVKIVDSTNGEGAAIYAKASAAILQYDTVFIKTSGNAAKISDALAKTATGDVAVAQVAFAADEYGWFMTHGSGGLARLSSSTEKNVALYVNVSVGVLSGLTASNLILGINAVTSVTTTVGAVTCVMNGLLIVRSANLLQI